MDEYKAALYFVITLFAIVAIVVGGVIATLIYFNQA